MAKSHPQLPAIILKRLPEKQGIYREILEHIQLTTINDRSREFSLGKDFCRLQAACISDRDPELWDWFEAVALDHPDVLGWKKRKIRRAMLLYERLKDIEAFLPLIQMRVQYYIADHAVNDSYIPLMRQQLMDGQPITVENFSSGIDPRIEDSYAASPRGTETTRARGLGLTHRGSASPTIRGDHLDDEDDDEPMPWEGNGHARKAELLDAEPPESGGKTGAEPFPAQKPNLGNPFSGNGNGSHKRPIERSVIRAQVAHEAAEHIHDATKTIRRACQNYGFKGRGQWEEAWFVRFRSGCEEALQALQEWEKVVLEESR